MTKRMKDFCEEYVVNGCNATQAYLKAYGCTYDSAQALGWRNLQKPEIKEYIGQLQKAQFEAACINAERIGIKLAEIAFADGDNEYYNATAQLKALDLLQKQLGLQKSKQEIDANLNGDIVINIED